MHRIGADKTDVAAEAFQRRNIHLQRQIYVSEISGSTNLHLYSTQLKESDGGLALTPRNHF